ncbi:MAG: biotin/lipoyl-containing protein, partial [bacterium]
MPKLGESIMEATVLKWHKKVGDRVAIDETLLDIATDKVDSEVPSTAEGILEEILCKENDVIPIGSVIAKIRNNADEPVTNVPTTTMPIGTASLQKEDTQIKVDVIDVPYQPSNYTNVVNGENERFYSPLVMKIAGTEGVSLAELEKVKGSGNQGRVTKKDILDYLENRKGNGHNGSYT